MLFIIWLDPVEFIMDIKYLIMQKLFVAFSDIVLEIIKSSDLEDSTKNILHNNISTISNILNIGNESNGKKSNEQQSEPMKTPPRTRPVRKCTKRLHSAESQAGNAKLPKTNDAITPTVQQTTTSILTPKPIHFSNKSPIKNTPVELRAIAPVKKVFLSNFPPETSTSAIYQHLKKSIPDLTMDFEKIEKIAFKTERSYSSFLIDTGENIELFGKLSDLSVWPLHTIVHEYRKPKQNVNFHAKRRYQRRT